MVKVLRRKNYVHYGGQLKKVRKELGYTLQQCADKVGVNLRTWQLWEASERPLRMANLNAICWALRIYPDCLMGEEIAEDKKIPSGQP